jgi:hypothetical protein
MKATAGKRVSSASRMSSSAWSVNCCAVVAATAAACADDDAVVDVAVAAAVKEPTEALGRIAVRCGLASRLPYWCWCCDC